MELDFWRERWKTQQIGFHRDVVSEELRMFWKRLNLPRDSQVLVPLCGKSLDILWLSAIGNRVVGVEISEIAIEDFFKESEIKYELDEWQGFKRYRSELITMLCGDFFELKPDDLGEVAAIYDRAALVALPKEVREKYVNHLCSFAKPGSQIFLVTTEYNEKELEGPPFNVEQPEIQTLFADGCTIDMFEVLPSKIKTIFGYERYYHIRYS